MITANLVTLKRNDLAACELDMLQIIAAVGHSISVFHGFVLWFAQSGAHPTSKPNYEHPWAK
jgi:hypothetical protein